jgi:hypothetical protein
MFFTNARVATMITCLVANFGVPQCFVKMTHFDSLHSSHLVPPTNHLHKVNASQPMKIVFNLIGKQKGYLLIGKPQTHEHLVNNQHTLQAPTCGSFEVHARIPCMR